MANIDMVHKWIFPLAPSLSLNPLALSLYTLSLCLFYFILLFTLGNSDVEIEYVATTENKETEWHHGMD